MNNIKLSIDRIVIEYNDVCWSFFTRSSRISVIITEVRSTSGKGDSSTIFTLRNTLTVTSISRISYAMHQSP
jgi:hypothetical protein